MASGDIVGLIHSTSYPGSNPATPDIRAGGSTPAEAFPVYDFDAGTVEYLDFIAVLSGYGGGGLTVSIKWAASSATSGNVVWQAAIRRIQDDAEDIDTAHTYDFNSVTAGAPTASGELSYDDITFTSGADMDSLANGEQFILRLSRNASSGSDTMAGDAEFVSVIIKET